MFRLTVFASSSPRTPKAYLNISRQVAAACVERQVTVVNGAGNHGCMGALNDALLDLGGRVEGVILRQFHEAGQSDPRLPLQIVDTMRERKRLLGHQTDAYLTLPGGPGTFEELWEVVVERQIGTHQRPVVVLDVNDFYQGFRQQLQRAADDDLLYGPAEQLMTFCRDIDQALLACRAPPAGRLQS